MKLFQKERDTLYTIYKRRLIELEQKEEYAKECAENYEVVRLFFDFFKGDSLIGMEKNKRDEEVLVSCKNTKSDLWIMLHSRKYHAVNNHPRIMATKIEDFTTGKMYIRIDDIITVNDNIGDGSIMMKYFIEEARKTGAEYISGELSSVDKEHFDRSEAFYKKHGFTVKFNDDRTSGSIELDLH